MARESLNEEKIGLAIEFGKWGSSPSRTLISFIREGNGSELENIGNLDLPIFYDFGCYHGRTEAENRVWLAGWLLLPGLACKQGRLCRRSPIRSEKWLSI